jgi:hypothetical protein
MNHRKTPPEFAYLGVHDGRVLEIIADHGSCMTAEQVADVIDAGGWVQRVPMDQAVRLLGTDMATPTWPATPNLPACEAAAREVS